MTQLHSIHHGLGIVRATNDVDIVLHVETVRGVAAATDRALRDLGYELRSAVDPRDNTHVPSVLPERSHSEAGPLAAPRIGRMSSGAYADTARTSVSMIVAAQLVGGLTGSLS